MMTHHQAHIKKPYKKIQHPREHWTKKKGKWKPKMAFSSLEEAQEFIAKHKMTQYSAYKCPYCGHIHIGFVKTE